MEQRDHGQDMYYGFRLIALLMDLTSRGRIVWFRYRGRGFDCHIDVAGEDHAGPTAFSLHREEADGVLSLIVTSAQADNFQLHQKYFGKELSDLWQAVLYRCAFPGIESIVQSLDDLGKEE